MIILHVCLQASHHKMAVQIQFQHTTQFICMNSCATHSVQKAILIGTSGFKAQTSIIIIVHEMQSEEQEGENLAQASIVCLNLGKTNEPNTCVLGQETIFSSLCSKMMFCEQDLV